GIRTKRGRQQPIAVQGLDPLTVQDVTLAPGNTLDRLGADQAAWEATGFSCLRERHPIHAGRCHGHRLDVTVHQPVGECLEISGICAKGAHDLLVIAIGYTGHDRMRTHVDTSGLGGHLAHTCEWTGFALGGAGTMAAAELAHGVTPYEDETRP